MFKMIGKGTDKVREKFVKDNLILESAKVSDEQHSQLLKLGGIFKSNKYYFIIS